jgi:hypothetical protein
VAASELELLRLDVDARQADTRELLPEHGEDGAGTAADLEQARPRLELRPVSDEPVAPVLRLLHEPLLFGRPVAVHVRAHRCASLLLRKEEPGALIAAATGLELPDRRIEGLQDPIPALALGPAEDSGAPFEQQLDLAIRLRTVFHRFVLTAGLERRTHDLFHLGPGGGG